MERCRWSDGNSCELYRAQDMRCQDCPDVEIARLRAELQKRDGAALAEAVAPLHEKIKCLRAEVERLTLLLKRHDQCWKQLHPREYTGELRDDTRAALATDGKGDKQ